jgi:RNA polymerase sigma factor (sigma-70 family)
MPAIAPAIRLPRQRARLDEDGVLLRRAANGDDGAFEAFHDRHANALLHYCQHVLGSRHEAEDAVQQSFFNAYRHIAAGNLPLKPRAWIYAIARNQSLSIIRSRHEQPAELAEASTLVLSEEVERRADLRELVRDVNRLPEEQRSAIVLFELGGLSQAEIAEVIGREPEQVKSLVYQARSTLMARRTARELPCTRVQRQLAVSRGGELDSRMLRHHLDGCTECQRYLDDLRRNRRRLALIFPAAPVLAASAGRHAAAVTAASKVRHAALTSHTAVAATATTVVAGAIAASVALGPSHSDRTRSRPVPPSTSPALPATLTPAPVRRIERSHHRRAAAHEASKPATRPGRKIVAPPTSRQESPTAQLPPRRPSRPPAHGHSPPATPRPPSNQPQAQSPPTPPAPTPTVVAAPPPEPSPPVHTNHGHHYGQIKNPNHGNHNGQHGGSDGPGD